MVQKIINFHTYLGKRHHINRDIWNLFRKQIESKKLRIFHLSRLHISYVQLKFLNIKITGNNWDSRAQKKTVGQFEEIEDLNEEVLSSITCCIIVRRITRV